MLLVWQAMASSDVSLSGCEEADLLVVAHCHGAVLTVLLLHQPVSLLGLCNFAIDRCLLRTGQAHIPVC